MPKFEGLFVWYACVLLHHDRRLPGPHSIPTQVLAMPRLDRLVNCARFVVIPSENVGEQFRFVVTPNKASDLISKEEEDPETDARVRVLQELAGDVKPFWEPDVVRKTVVEVSSEEVATRLRRIVVEERGLARVVNRSMSSM